MEVTKYKKSSRRKELVGESRKKCSKKEYFTTSVFPYYDLNDKSCYFLRF